MQTGEQGEDGGQGGPPELLAHPDPKHRVLLAASLVTSSPNPALAGTGLLTTVDIIVVLQPSNPQSYDPQAYLLLSMLLLLVAALAFVLVRVLFPTSLEKRRAWVLASVRRDLQMALRGTGRARSEDETRLLDASRIGTLIGLPGGTSAERDADLASVLRLSDLGRAARRVRRALDRLTERDTHANNHRRNLARAARAALAAADAHRLRRLASALAGAGPDAPLSLAADMAWAADLIDAPARHGGPEAAR